MKLTDDHKVQIFCAVLNATVQATFLATLEGKQLANNNPVESASLRAAEAIAKLQSKAWESN